MPQFNILSIDLEEWHHLGFGNDIAIQNAIRISPQERVVKNTLKLLDIFQKANVKATFFVLGSIAEKFPDLIKEIDKQGHEIACHGYNHASLFKQTTKDFSIDLDKALEILSTITKQKIIGYRAPNLSMPDALWPYEALTEKGFIYDSSQKISKQYSSKGNTFYYVQISKEKTIIELPLSHVQIGPFCVPISGGTYFRHLPYTFLKWSIETLNYSGRSAIIYLHPRDIDTSLPKIDLSWPNRLRYSSHIGNTADKIQRLLEHFYFISFRKFLDK